MDLAEVATDLYVVPPDDFVAARTAAQQRARAEGDRAWRSGSGSWASRPPRRGR